jgi:hypothetical protein
MNNNWAINELNFTNLGDKRLNQRLIQLADRFIASPESPINQACCNWAETKAAYRFFQNDSFSYQEILRSHVNATKQRCMDYKTILAVQDTSYFTYTSHKKTEGLCSLTKKAGKNKKELITAGLIMHTSLALSPEGLPLGILDQKIYSREPLSKEMKEIKQKSHNNALSIEEKESYRWLESLQNSNNVLLSTENIQLITICDREADIYDFFLLSDIIHSQVLVRANHNRTVNKKSTYSENSGEKLWDFVESKKCQGTIKIKIPAQDKQSARIALCNVYFSKIILNPSRNNIKSKNEKLPNLNLFAIYIKEKNAQENIDPIDWMLLTNIPIITFEEALEKINWYCLRWRIEVFHKILKSGLKVENCRLSKADRLIRYLSLMSIVAWRIFWITLISRVSPKTSCIIFLNDIEWKVLFFKFNDKKRIPKTPPSIQTCVIWIAQLGGFLARKSDKEPGITHIWRGLKKFSNILEGVELGSNTCG